MNLGNGNTVFGGHSEGVATISIDPPTLLAAKCMGLGLITGENEFGAKVYCTFRHSDSFDLLVYSNEKAARPRSSAAAESGRVRPGPHDSPEHRSGKMAVVFHMNRRSRHLSGDVDRLRLRT